MFTYMSSNHQDEAYDEPIVIDWASFRQIDKLVVYIPEGRIILYVLSMDSEFLHLKY